MVMTSWGIRIQTKANPAMAATLPRFATAEEARRYGRWLLRKDYLHVLAHEAFETISPVTAVFPRGSKAFRWARDER
jgi:hypothetical protein